MSIEAPIKLPDTTDNVLFRCNLVLLRNIPTNCGQEELKEALSKLGPVKTISLFPSARQLGTNPSSLVKRICFIKMESPHLNFLFAQFDKFKFGNETIEVELCDYDEIPSDDKCLDLLLGKKSPEVWPEEIISKVYRAEGSRKQIVRTINPVFELNCLPPYPDLTLREIDSDEIQRIRKTIFIKDIPNEIPLEDVVNFFDTECGEIKKSREAEPMKKSQDQNTKFLFIEFSSPNSLINAFKLDGTTFSGFILQVQHSTDSILDPATESKLIDEDLKNFRDRSSKSRIINERHSESRELYRQSRSKEKEVERSRSREFKRSRRSRSKERISRRSPSSHDENYRRSRSRERYSRSHRSGDRSSRRSRSRDRDSRRSSDHHKHSRHYKDYERSSERSSRKYRSPSPERYSRSSRRDDYDYRSSRRDGFDYRSSRRSDRR